MQFVEKHDNTVPSSDNWRTKVSPIPTFLQENDGSILFSTEEKDKGSPLMKGILYTILTATIGVLVGWAMSYLMRAPQQSTVQALEELVSSVKTQSETVLSAAKSAPGQDAGKETQKGDESKSATDPLLAALSSLKGPPSTTTAPVAPPLPKEAAAKPTPVPPTPTAVATEKPKDSTAPATTAASALAASPMPAPIAEKPKDTAPKKPIVPGPVFLKGTNPYGPPPLVEQDIFNPSTLLKVEYDPETAPPTRYDPGTTETPSFNQLLQDPTPVAPPVRVEQTLAIPGYQVQFGAFSSRLNATQFANRLQEKGYEVNIYEGRNRNRGAWYFVRLNRMLDHSTALETAKNIQSTEKFLPMVVQPTDTEKKLW